MSEMAKKARAAMKAKAKSITTDPHQKVDSSTWTPPEPLETTAKTGMRPVSRRAYKKGGKVEGANAKANMGKKPRASGGKTMANDWINRNAKEANELRPGIKHVGGMKKGGRAAHATDGTVGAKMLNKLTTPEYRNALEDKSPQPTDLYDEDQVKDLEKGYNTKKTQDPISSQPKLDPRANSEAEYFKNRMSDEDWGKADQELRSANLKEIGYRLRGGSGRGNEHLEDDIIDDFPETSGWDARPQWGPHKDSPKMKKGGRAKRMDGGMMPPPGMAQPMDPRLGIVKPKAMNFTNNPVVPGQKKGGKVEKHEDVAEDKALIKKMVKASARVGKKTGGGIFTGPSYPGKIPGVTGGRIARASGGKTKGKTDINIIINGGGKDQGQMGGMPGMPRPIGMAGGMPPPPPPGPMPPPGMMTGAPPMPPMPAGGPPGLPPGMMPPGMPPGGPPLQRKSGGRAYHSAKDMDAGAASGEGRLEKTEIAKFQRNKRKAGGRTYRSYKDMDAGAASGLGRLEKTEIAAHKG